jgi:hypothetical protein
MSCMRLDVHGQTEFVEAPNETSSDLDFVAPFETKGSRAFVVVAVLADRRSIPWRGSDCVASDTPQTLR